jgi:PBP1b-binding outer membrane lipoprotein LpoB
MKIKLASIILLACLVAGCASFNATVYNTEKTTTDAATAAVHAYNQWYALETNSPGADLAKINAERDSVYDASRKLGASLALVDSLRVSYQANSANTNKLALQAGLDALSSQSSNIVSIVHLFLTK